MGLGNKQCLLSCVYPQPLHPSEPLPRGGPQLLTMGLSGSCPPSLPPAGHTHDPGVLGRGVHHRTRSNTSQWLPWTGCLEDCRGAGQAEAFEVGSSKLREGAGEGRRPRNPSPAPPPHSLSLQLTWPWNSAATSPRGSRANVGLGLTCQSQRHCSVKEGWGAVWAGRCRAQLVGEGSQVRLGPTLWPASAASPRELADGQSWQEALIPSQLPDLQPDIQGALPQQVPRRGASRAPAAGLTPPGLRGLAGADSAAGRKDTGSWRVPILGCCHFCCRLGRALWFAA